MLRRHQTFIRIDSGLSLQRVNRDQRFGGFAQANVDVSFAFLRCRNGLSAEHHLGTA